ncbi:MAG TPA: ribonuclease R family protein [Mycobacteriales bacterium]|nr:ribonuclease R family protein [Mycobacteriales bacterium]
MTRHSARQPRATAPPPSAAASSPPSTAASTGLFRPHVRGFGFVDLAEPLVGATGEPLTSCFVPPPLTGPLLDGDVVAVTLLLEDDGRSTATEVTIVQRTRSEVFGVVEDGLRLRLDPYLGSGQWSLEGRVEDLPVGAAVLADITGDRTADPSDEWADPLDAETLLERVRVRHLIASEHPAEARAEAARLAEAPPGRRRSTTARRDLRALPTFTIDAPHSMDLDDALSVYRADPDGGIRVLVHIADVATHVRPGTPLDAEARRTGTSVYLPGWVRPMLPRVLSEQALSLVPDADRDALTVEMRIAADGAVTAADVYASRIRSDLRLSYETASEVLGGSVPDDVPPEVVDALRWLRTAGARLGVQRLRRGGVEARRVEPELAVAVVDGVAEQVAATPSNPANLLIERLMVAANESVAGWLADRGLPGVFRVHPAPGPDAAPALEAFCTAAGFHPGFGPELTPLDLAALSAQLDAAADETAAAVWDVLLGFLGRASYVPKPGRHFGLASDGYVHFTSPLRRYADLMVHRVVHAFLSGHRDLADYPDGGDLSAVCEHLNTVSRTAAVAERQMRKMLWLVTLSRQVAEEPSSTFRGRVTGVGAKGVFVTLDGSHVTGMVAVRELPGRGWKESDDGLALVDAAGHRLGYGDAVVVQVVQADVEAAQLELTLHGTEAGSGRSNRPRTSAGAGRGGRVRSRATSGRTKPAGDEQSGG